ncbi:esterase/lipase family protein [Actinoplanes sp. CA-030573]|uniref:esterase/lipase family protein n=1 Tax=Actinoplanes sp. CA-030573 TaxID=3239898 RepID=UPI003D8D7327
MTEIFEIASPDDAALDVVFLHGLDGDARKSWSSGGDDSFWPLWLAQDVERIAVWSVDYDAWSSGWRGRSMSIPDRAINVLALLQNHEIGRRPICFVAHSMGGLLVKEMLLHASEAGTAYSAVAEMTKGVVFLATPHTGSGTAKAVRALGSVYRGTPAVEDLVRNEPHLRQLNDRYRDWLDYRAIRTLAFFETQATGGLRVVDESSANPGIAKVRPIPVDANHVSICKPVSRRDVVYGQIRRFIAGLLDGQVNHPQSAGRHVAVDGANYGVIVTGDGNVIDPKRLDP